MTDQESAVKATTENLAKSAKNLEEVKSWPVLKREKKNCLWKKQKANAENTY